MQSLISVLGALTQRSAITSSGVGVGPGFDSIPEISSRVSLQGWGRLDERIDSAVEGLGAEGAWYCAFEIPQYKTMGVGFSQLLLLYFTHYGFLK